jgi:hypothetical protein
MFIQINYLKYQISFSLFLFTFFKEWFITVGLFNLIKKMIVENLEKNLTLLDLEVLHYREALKEE